MKTEAIANLQSSSKARLIIPIALCAAAVLYGLLPALATGLPLKFFLSSDSQSWITLWQTLVRPEILRTDEMFPRSLPAIQLSVHTALAHAGYRLHINLFSWSLFLSFINLFIFLSGLYLLLLRSTHRQIEAAVLTFASIIPVHALGGIMYGFEPSGFLLRDLAMGLSIFLLFFYYETSGHRIKFVLLLFICGGLANFYIGLFPHLALVLLGSELMRGKRALPSVLAGGIAFLAGSSPTLAGVFLRDASYAGIDPAIIKVRYSYLFLTKNGLADFQYLRRFLLYALLVPILVRRDLQKDAFWTRIWISSFLLSLMGLCCDQFPVMTKFLFSRCSVWFFLSSMVIVFESLMANKVKSRFSAFVVLSAIFLLQSNLPTLARKIHYGNTHKTQLGDLADVTAFLRDHTSHDALIAAPADELNDIANSIRTYALRPVYVAYKDGGWSIVDGRKGRLWSERWRRNQESFQDPARLREMMKSEKIQYAVIKSPKTFFFDPSLRQIFSNHTYNVLKYEEPREAMV